MDLLDEMLNRRWLREEKGQRVSYRLTRAGENALSQLGVPVSNAAAQRRPFAYGCLDWTERRPHLRGSLAAVVLAALTTSGVVKRQKGSRAVTMDRPLQEWLKTAPS